jgi:predicted amidohydrolase
VTPVTPMRVALAQVECPWADTQGNLKRMAGWAERAKAGSAQMVVFPELCVSGICKDERLASITETLDGPSVAFVRRLARGLGLAIGFGFSEMTDGLPFNTYVVVESDGELAGVYRKNHIPKLEMPFWQGDTARPVFRALERSMAVSICWDNRHPELLRHYSRCGAEIVLMPHAWDADVLDEDDTMIDYDSMEEIAARLRRTGRLRWKTHDQMRDDFYGTIPGLAREGRFWALFVNQAGRPHPCLDFVGPSFVVDPSGRVVAETRDREEQLVYAEVGGASRAVAAR